MKTIVDWLTGLGLGAGLMYMFDPDRGVRRRALVRDQVLHALHQVDDAIGATSRDARNRAHGLRVELASRLTRPGEMPDDLLQERIRARMGHLVSHPRSIEVTVYQGNVRLSGPILAGDLNRLLAAIASMPGVNSIENQLEVYQQAGNVPGLQGNPVPPVLKHTWSPAARLLMGILGGSLALYGAVRRGGIGTALSTVGLGLVSRGLMRQ